MTSEPDMSNGSLLAHRVYLEATPPDRRGVVWGIAWAAVNRALVAEAEVARLHAAVAAMPASGETKLNLFHLEQLGLAEEFSSFGCDVVEWLGQALLDTRCQASRLKARTARLRAGLDRIRRAVENGDEWVKLDAAALHLMITDALEGKADG